MTNLTITNEISSLFMADIDAIDFTMVKLKIQDKEEGLGWIAAQCDEAEKDYKKFLALKRTYPEKEIVPNKLVDLFWHQHILDTQKYASDCETIFGYFVHHFPYFGMKDEQDMQDLVDAFEETKALHALHFVGDYAGTIPKCKAHRCRTACKPVKCK
ncbi:hypothetical protein ACVW0P_001830 [Mucilaginibacter sp. UYNi724]